MTRKYKITVVGTGYVGMSMAALLGQHNEVIALDIDEARVNLINQGKPNVVDAEIEHYLADKELSLAATLDKALAYRAPVFADVATPTDYDPETNYFDTSSVEAVIGKQHEPKWLRKKRQGREHVVQQFGLHRMKHEFCITLKSCLG